MPSGPLAGRHEPATLVSCRSNVQTSSICYASALLPAGASLATTDHSPVTSGDPARRTDATITANKTPYLIMIVLHRVIAHADHRLAGGRCLRRRRAACAPASVDSSDSSTHGCRPAAS